MLRFDTENQVFAMKGTMVEVLSELVSFIRLVYSTINEDNPKMAEQFKEMLTRHFHLAFESTEEVAKRSAEMEQAAKESREELLSILDDLKEMLMNKTSYLDESGNNIKDSDGDDLMSFEDFKKMINKKDEES